MRITPFPPTQIGDFDEHFSSKTLARAEDLVTTRGAQLTEHSRERITAHMRNIDGSDFDTRISADGHYSCTCDENVQPCQHIAATLLLVVRRDAKLEAKLDQLEAQQLRVLITELSQDQQWRDLIHQSVDAFNPQALEGHVSPDSQSIEIERWNTEDVVQRESSEAEQLSTSNEDDLRSHLETPEQHFALVQHLQNQGRTKEAFEIAANGVRDELHRLKRGQGGIEVLVKGSQTTTQTAFPNEMLKMITMLREQQPAFEWELAAFRIKPTAEHYKTLRTHSEFGKVANSILDNLEPSVRFDIALNDNDRATLEAMLAEHPTPAYAKKVKHLFPERTKIIFKKAMQKWIDKGAKEYYREAAQLAKEYQSIEDPAAFKAWLEPLLNANARRLTLINEFEKQGLSK